MADRSDDGDEPSRIVADSVRARYEAHGADAYYREHAGDYTNPHEPEIRDAIRLAVERWKPRTARVLDLAAGSGEATLALRELGVSADAIDACDPFLFAQYERRVGRACERMSFEDIAAGALAGRSYDLVVCSFALHLAEESRLPGICHQLALVADRLLVLAPHKRPDIRPGWGWESLGELTWARVRARVYASALRVLPT
jgi:SAM-dependent methyltransferase